MLVHRLSIPFVAVLILLAGCAMKPPVQEMAEARSALRAAQQLEGESALADQRLESAEQALHDAAEAIDQQQYERARRKAAEAKVKAQQAARIKQSSVGD